MIISVRSSASLASKIPEMLSLRHSLCLKQKCRTFAASECLVFRLGSSSTYLTACLSLVRFASAREVQYKVIIAYYVNSRQSDIFQGRSWPVGSDPPGANNMRFSQIQ